MTIVEAPTTEFPLQTLRAGTQHWNNVYTGATPGLFSIVPQEPRHASYAEGWDGRHCSQLSKDRFQVKIIVFDLGQIGADNSKNRIESPHIQ